MQRLYIIFYLFILIFLALPMMKLGTPRIEQLLVLLTFFIVFTDDLLQKDLDFKILFFLIIGAILMILISMNSDYPKVDEKNYFIKFLFIYPVAFYVGARALPKLGIKNIISVFDFALLFYIVSWFIVMYIPVPTSILYEIVHLRDFGNGGLEFLPIQGTFYEAGALGIIVGVILSFSILARYEFDIWPKDKRYSYTLYFLVLYMLVMSKNKTVWLAYVMILFSMILYKGYLLLTRSNYYYTDMHLQKDIVLSKFLKLNSIYLMSAAFLLITVFFTYNSLAPEPFISMKELQFKLEHERGAQYAVTWDLIVKSNFFGGYGFGFVAAYFEDLNILGVGKGDGSINNIILDIWLQGSIVGVIYLMSIFYLAFNNRMFLTMTIPLYLFFFGLTNPIVAEEFFLMLGLSYSLSHMVEDEKVYLKILNREYN